jgi:Tfp pilus assembly protein PilO
MEERILLSKRIILPISFIVVLLVGWIIMVYWPASKELGRLNRRLSDLKEKERQIIPEEKIQAMRIAVDSLEAYLNASLDRFYPEEELIDLGRAIESIGKEYSLQLVNITPDYESLPLFQGNPKEISELPVTVDFSGGFPDLTRFLDTMSDFPFVMRFEEMTLSKEGSLSRELSISLKGVVVFRNVKTPEPKPEERMANTGVLTNQT